MSSSLYFGNSFVTFAGWFFSVFFRFYIQTIQLIGFFLVQCA